MSGFQWICVRRYDDARFAAMRARYVTGIVIVLAAMIASSVVADDAPRGLAAVVVLSVLAVFVQVLTAADGASSALAVTD